MAWKHPDVGLGELVERAAAFLDILIIASGFQSDGTAAVWNAQTLRQAFGWASYFEQVLKNLPAGKDGEASRQAFDLALDALLAAVPLPPGVPVLSFSLLENARRVLAQVLSQSLPIRNAWLVANYLESDGNGCGDLWEDVIHEMSERCLASGRAKSLQQTLSVAAESGVRRGSESKSVTIWKNSPVSSGVAGVGALPFEKWTNKALRYATSADTIHKLSGATLVFSADKEEWNQVLDSLQYLPDPEGQIGIKAKIAELCCLFLASPEWKDLPSRLLHSGCKSLRDLQLLSTKCHTDGWSGKIASKPCLHETSIRAEVRDEVEGYLRCLIGSDEGWCSLAPILLAAAWADSAALQMYLETIEKRICASSPRICPSDCSCKTCCHRSDAEERAWCLLVVLDDERGCALAQKLCAMLPATGRQ